MHTFQKQNRFSACSAVGSALIWMFAASVCTIANGQARPVPTEEAQTDPVAQLENAAQQAALDAADQNAEEVHTIPIPESWKRLGKNEIWIDFKDKSVIISGQIVMVHGGLEMFICPPNTKEHESVVSANALASEVHAALVALGGGPGSPVQWDPDYKPVSGPIMQILVRWLDQETGRPISRWGKEMVRDYETGKPLSHDWVFGGSITEKDPETGQTYYYGDGGELVCLSNFTTATIDLNVPSSSSDGSLLYEAFTENLPPVGTKVYVMMTPGEFFEERANASPTETVPPGTKPDPADLPQK